LQLLGILALLFPSRNIVVAAQKCEFSLLVTASKILSI
jgi:hypothetical protein